MKDDIQRETVTISRQELCCGLSNIFRKWRAYLEAGISHP
jgi:hypothetical protein